MVEINFMEMYDLIRYITSQNIFEVTIFHCNKYFKRVKNQ